MKNIQAGLMIRRQIRRYLMQLGVQFTEEKGWVDSVFYFDCSNETAAKISNDIARWEKETSPPLLDKQQ